MKIGFDKKFIVDTYYYIIKVSGEGRTYYKIGEGKTNRPEALIKKYMDRAVITAEAVFIDKLPNNGIKRLNDKTIHKNLKLLKKVDPFIIRGLLNEKDGKTEFFEIPKNWNDEKLINYIKETVDELSKSSNNFVAKVSSLYNHALHYDPTKKHLVNYKMIESILKKVNDDDFKDKNVLLIGQFEPGWISSFARFSNVYIWHDSNEQKYVYKIEKLNERITYINDFEELVNLNKKFNYIIANPPYENGNDITRAIIDNIDFDAYVNLMPCSDYKKGSLYKNVTEVESVEDTFDDATVGSSLTVALISKEVNNDITYDEFENLKRDPRFREFYALNAKIHHYVISKAPLGGNAPADKIIDRSKNIRCAFAITARTVLDGAHKASGNAFDVDWNLRHSKTFDDVHVAPQGGATTAFIYFNTEKEHSNMCRFWYFNSLMNDLLKGLNKASGSPVVAIPHIDWSKDRDYENLTLEDLMNILREENLNK